MKRSLLIGGVVGAVFMVLAFWGVPLEQFADAMSTMDWRYLIPIAALFFLQEGLRALRQLIMLRPLAPEMTYRSSLSIFFLSFFCIHLFPARLGEFVRPWLLLKREDIPLGSGLGVVVAERAVDLVATLAMLWAVLVFADMPPALTVGDTEISLVEAGRALGLATVPAALVGCFSLAFFHGPMLRLMRRIIEACARAVPRLERPGEVLLSFAGAFASGFATFRQPGRLAAVIVLTATTWGSTAFIYLFMAAAFGIGDYIAYAEAAGVMVITMLGGLLPAPPGMAGVQEAFGRGALALFGVKGPGLDGPALAYAVTVHWYQMVLQTGAAAYFFWADGESLRELASGAKEAEASVEG